MMVFILPALWWIRIRGLWSFLMGESWITILNGLPWKRTEIILSFLRLHQSQIDGWMASPTQRTWVWVDSTSWWWTGRPGMLWFMGSQRVGHDWATELNWICQFCPKPLRLYQTLCDPMDFSPPGSSVLGDSPGKDTGVGCHLLLLGIFLTQGLNPRLLILLYWQAGSLPLETSGKYMSIISPYNWGGGKHL